MDEPQYIPQPIDPAKFPLDADLAAALERLPRTIHDLWASKRLSEGWRLGPRDDNQKTHPSLIPFEQLDPSERSYDRAVALQTIVALKSMGFEISRASDFGEEFEGALKPHEFEQLAAMTKQRVDQTLEPIDHDAMRHRSWYQTLAMLSAVFGTLAVLLAIAQMFVASHHELVRTFFGAEAISALIALAAAIYGIYVGTHHHWLLARFKAERLRALHATSLIDILTGTFDRQAFESRIAQIAAMDSAGMREWQRLDLVPRPELESVRPAIHGHLDEFRKAYLDARLAPQASYLSKAEQQMELWDRRSRKIPPMIFFASIACVAAHAVLHLLHSENAERLAHLALLLAACLPVIAAGLRMYREAAQLSRNASRFASKAFALSMLRDQLIAATSSSQALAVAWRAEQMLEAEHREWLRLMSAAELSADELPAAPPPRKVSCMSLYPLKFKPRFVEKMWGGRKLETVLGKNLPPEKMIGESWELYDFPPRVVENSTDWISAEIANGPLAGRTLHWLVSEFGLELMGDVKLSAQDQFPILIKFLDAREDLSVQVHPDQDYANTHPEAHLKSEAWYVLSADEGARIFKGVQPGTTRESFAKEIESGNVERQLKSVPVKADHCHYLPSGTVHALGAGILVAEVQTPSDTTFRVSDFNRIDPTTGKPRELHVEQALQCIDFSGKEVAQPRSHVAGFFTTVSRLVTSPFFKLEKVRFTEGVEEPVPYDEPVVWIMLSGEAEVKVDDVKEPTKMTRGETILLPAQMKNPIIKTNSDCVWLEVTFPSKAQVE